MSEFDSKDPLWKLLGHARAAEVSPYFSRRVLRELRALEAKPRFWERLFSHPARLALAGAACALMALLSLTFIPDRNSSAPVTVSAPDAGSVETFDPASEMAAIEYLGQLMAVADPGQLDDAALGDLFF